MNTLNMKDISKWAKENGITECPSCGTPVDSLGDEFKITSVDYECGARHGFVCDDSHYNECESGCGVKGNSIEELKSDIERGYVCEDVKIEELEEVVGLIADRVGDDDKAVLNKLLADILAVLSKYRRSRDGR